MEMCNNAVAKGAAEGWEKETHNISSSLSKLTFKVKSKRIKGLKIWNWRKRENDANGGFVAVSDSWKHM